MAGVIQNFEFVFELSTKMLRRQIERESDTPLPPAVCDGLVEDFAGSDLPWRVDVVDWSTTNPAFRAIISRDKVVLSGPTMGTC